MNEIMTDNNFTAYRNKENGKLYVYNKNHFAHIVVNGKDIIAKVKMSSLDEIDKREDTSVGSVIRQV